MALLVFIGCYLGAGWGTSLVFPEVETAVLFPPYAVLTAALLLAPTRWWWLLVLASAAGNFFPHQDFERSVSFVLLAEAANVTRALVAAGGVRLLGGRIVGIEGLRGMAIFLACAAVLGPVAGAFIGATDVVLHAPGANFWVAWRAWLLSNVLTGVTLLPLILVLATLRISRDRVTMARVLEAAVLALALLWVGIHVLTRPAEDAPSLAPYEPLPLLLWAALRFGPAGTIVALSAISFLTIYGVSGGAGPFVEQRPAASIIQLQSFLIVLYVPFLLLAAVIQERAKAARALHRSQLQYRSIVEDQTELICRFSRDGTITFVNNAYCRYFNLTRADLIGKTFWQFLPPASRVELREHLDSITPEHPVASLEHSVIASDGEIRWQQWTDRGFFDAAGRIVEFQAVGRDVTARKRAEEEHRELEAKRQVEEVMEEAARRKDEFLAMLGHELRNPLAPIGLAVEILRMRAREDDAVNWARDVVARQLRQLSRLVDDLLDVSRISQGTFRLSESRIDFASVVSDAVETSRPLIEARGHDLQLDVEDGTLPVRGDSARLVQVVSNLLNNAAKYTDPGGRITVSARAIDGNVALSVSDTGVGIPADQLEEVFEMFSQSEVQSGRSQGGLGIGLTLVRKLVDMHGGTVEAHSAGHGRGSQFIVTLPREPDELPASAATDVPDAEPAAALPTLAEAERKRVLIVDDNVDAAAGLDLLLRLQRHEVAVAHDGPAAIAAAERLKPEVVLLDIGLPGMSGLEVAKQLREHAPGRAMLLVATTGLGQTEDRRRTAAAGFDYHLTKPIDLDSLATVLRQVPKPQ